MNAAADGDNSAADQLLPLVYEQLRKSAQLQMAAERPDHTHPATALVNEAYLKLVGPREAAWAGRGHCYAAAAQAMRRILIDQARTRNARQVEVPTGDGHHATVARLVLSIRWWKFLRTRHSAVLRLRAYRKIPDNPRPLSRTASRGQVR